MGKLIGIFLGVVYCPFILLRLLVLFVLGLFWGPIRVDSKESTQAILITIAVALIIVVTGIVALVRWLL